ncbi:MAG: hypothetical protein ABS939_00650 [Psychrobacillus sp.]
MVRKYENGTAVKIDETPTRLEEKIQQKKQVIKNVFIVLAAVLLFLAFCFIIALVFEYHKQIVSFISYYFQQLPSLLQTFIQVIFLVTCFRV